ncbi:MAG: adenylate/guanylate cyclase domain-containing protein [Alphaproteobacteria bacterium]|nr:adenylate/guanylate cyclase domain-containing protein [Alphaproteobacteria bacterium]
MTGVATAVSPPRWRRWLPLRAAPPAALPRRVAQAIAEEQRRGEIVIGWVQAAIVVVFAVLYSLSRKTAPADAPFAPIPWAIGLYALFTCARLALAYRTKLPRSLLAGSIAVDLALLFVTIWSFHIQYAQPPAFYLKAPTLLYVFIFVALRTLRFESFYVLLSGALAAAGWLALVVVAAADPAGMPVTRDYVHYMTSASILWGAEFDKIISILVVTLVLAATLQRARRLLMAAVVEGAAARDLKRFFAPEVVSRITGADEAVEPGHGEIRDAAILFVDLRGFTPLSRMLSAPELVALLAEYQSRLVPVVRAHGGRVDKFLGDGILASFGAVRPDPQHAAAALAAVDALMAEAEAWRRERAAAGRPAPRIGAAVAAGPVLLGVIGDAVRLEYTVIGDAVNLAAKLEKQTKAEGVRALTDGGTYAAALAQGYAGTAKSVRPAVAVAGVDRPLDLVVLA